MKRLSKIIESLISGLDTVSRKWERNKVGERLARILVDVVLLVHLAKTFYPH